MKKVFIGLLLAISIPALAEDSCIKVEKVEISRKILSVGKCANSPLQSSGGSDTYTYLVTSSLSVNVSLKTNVTITDTCSMTVLHSKIVDSTIIETKTWTDYVRFALTTFGQDPSKHSMAIKCEGYRSSLGNSGN